jgi:GntR family transcriptional regulator / MocR family aminotransferase
MPTIFNAMSIATRNPKPQADNGLMWGRLFKRFAHVSQLQSRVRDMIAQAVQEGLLAPGDKLPSSRQLAAELGVARVTVSLALQQLVDSGLIVVLARSAYRVANDALDDLTAAARTAPSTAPTRDGAPQARQPAWAQRLKLQPGLQRNIAKPANWQELPYPFIYGQFDHSLFPLAQWRECAKETMHVAAIRSWAPDHIDRDHEPLVQQIQQRLLPARGIWAKREEILVTAGAQQAMFMLAQLLVDSRTVVGIEEPGYPDARNNLLLRTAAVRPLPVDEEGLLVSRDVARCRYVYVTPSHHCPTTVTMSLPRRLQLLDMAERNDMVLIEDDHESELNFTARPSPALKSLDTSGRVIYVGSLSKTLAHGLRIGYVVASARLIQELRAMRRLMMRHPPTNNEHTAALFIAHGFQAAYVRKLNLAYRARAQVLVKALGQHLPQAAVSTAHGGSAVWAKLPKGIDTRRLAGIALGHGIVIEPGDVFFASARAPTNYLRLGYSSITQERIAPGIEKLARLVRDLGGV